MIGAQRSISFVRVRCAASSVRLGLFSNAYILQTIQSIDLQSVIKDPPPITCTVTAPVNLFFGRTGRPSPIPIYADLSQLQQTDAIDLLMQTGAIPEVFPAKPVRGQYYVDGGLADNTPIAGVADDRADTIIVVYLNHRFRRLPDVRRYEAFRLREISNAKGLDQDGKVTAWLLSVKFMPIIPSENLGGLFCGTLNFAQRKARKLIALGYQDTLVKLRELSLPDGR